MLGGGGIAATQQRKDVRRISTSYAGNLAVVLDATCLHPVASAVTSATKAAHSTEHRSHDSPHPLETPTQPLLTSTPTRTL